MLNFVSKTLIPETTRQSPGIVKAAWFSYCPGLSLLKNTTFGFRLRTRQIDQSSRICAN